MTAILLMSSSTSTAEKKRPKAFCAGGDVKQVYYSGIAPIDPKFSSQGSLIHGQGIPGVGTAEFFRQEYFVNHMLATASDIPHVSFWDGFVMGGGVGLSIHSRYRIATENTIWSMPETAIGLFPDVGSMYWMPRLLPAHRHPGLAIYLALTGQRLMAPDLIATGLATHYIPSTKLVEVEQALIQASLSKNSKTNDSNNEAIDSVMKSFHECPTGKELLNSDAIARAFGGSSTVTIEAIVSALEEMVDRRNDNSTADAQLSKEFATVTLATLQKMSPTSLKVTLEGLRRGSTSGSLSEDLTMEFRMAQACARPGSDFYEGIRSALIDKDNKPQWDPSHWSEVTDEKVSSYFAPLQHEWEWPP